MGTFEETTFMAIESNLFIPLVTVTTDPNINGLKI
jgi:hypothetical protein